MKNYIKPSIEIVDLSIKENIAKVALPEGASLYTTNGGATATTFAKIKAATQDSSQANL